MNLICQLKDFFFREEPSVSSYDRLLADLNRACSSLPEGQVFLVTGDGEFTVRLTWKPQQMNPDKRMFSLNGQDEVTEWIEAVPTATKEPKPVDIEKEKKEPKQKRMMQRLSRYLKLHYAFRYNLLTERTECARLNEEKADEAHHLTYTPVDSRTLNGIALSAIENGVECWDRDVKRYVESDHVQAYHPFELYFKNLPEWDGKDRVTELARRVSDKDVWIRSFHRWMLAVTAQWTGSGNRDRRANSVAPLLVSPTQGLGKSTFCRMLLPKELRDYFTESFDLTNASSAENKLASYGLINLDEFDRLPVSRMPQLKNLMQMEDLRVRRAYRRSAEALPRIASFIGTSNRRDLLTDLSGSRRFICVEVEHAIDCTTPIDHAQLYAQLLHELNNGERCWFSKAEEAEIQAANRPFYRITPAEELIGSCFAFAESGEQGARLMSAADIYTVLKKKNPAALKDCSCTSFSRLLAQLGRRVHTRYGNGYWVKKI
ncbi:VapE domain-containing protein [Bacteroides togonis]|uniref:VapE domain-containing protein n=1 Tax=Bacteroides togonis TaxID=1917883 RepID=UPI00094AC9AD|nr:VapE domain-containing protein [Bacteroides togonis]